MTQAEYEQFTEAINTICDFCEADECENCMVERLEEAAYIEAVNAIVDEM